MDPCGEGVTLTGATFVEIASCGVEHLQPSLEEDEADDNDSVEVRTLRMGRRALMVLVAPVGEALLGETELALFSK